MTHTSQDFAKFLESLKVKNEWPFEIVEGRRFDLPYGDIPKPDIYSGGAEAVSYVRYIELRMVRAESNAKPETLAEDIKAYMRQLMRDVDLAYAEPHQASADRRHRAELACLEWLKVSEAEASK